MKFIILIPCLILTFRVAFYGQIPIGIKFGINGNDIIIENAPFLPVNLYRPSIGFHVGVTSNFRLMNPLTFNPELLFIQKVASTNFRDDQIPGSLNANSVEGKVNLNYLELPFLLSFNSKRLVSFQIGPNLGLRISAKGTTDKVKSDMRELFNKPFDFGVSGGLKFNLSNKLSISGR